MQSALPTQSPLAHRAVLFQDSLSGKTILAVAATVLVAACAHVTVPLPFTPVPLTLQNFAVILVGMMLGPVAGFSAMVLYLAEGAAGMPVFNPHGLGGVAQLMGPTAGYLFSYPLAAACAGWLVRSLRPISSRFSRAIVAGTISTGIILAMGAGWLGISMHLSSSTAWSLAVAPFLLGETIKVTAAAGLFSSVQRWRRS